MQCKRRKQHRSKASEFEQRKDRKQRHANNESKRVEAHTNRKQWTRMDEDEDDEDEQ